MMKLGALDYVVKDSDFLEFLPKVVERVMEQMAGREKLLAIEKDLHESEETLARLARAVEQVQKAIVITDTGGKIQYVNPAFERITGWSAPEAIGRNPNILKSGKHGGEFYREMWETLRQGEVWRGHLINKKKDGTLYEDDEEMLVEMGQRTLERLGYKVTAKTGSQEALEAFRAAPGDFDLVITDQTMPNMAGDALARELLQIRPDLPIILCTGFSHVVTPEKAKALGIREFLMKPLLARELGEAIRRVLG